MNPLVILLVASIVEFFAAVSINYPSFAIASGIVGICFAGVLMILQGQNPEGLVKVIFSNFPMVGVVTVEMLFAFFLFAWWAVATGIMTFQGPFTATTNGYFATWAALSSSVMLLSASVPAVAEKATGAKEKLLGAPLLIFLVCSLVVLFAGLQFTQYGLWQVILGVIIAGIGIFYSLLFSLAGEKLDASMQQYGTLIMLVLWAVEAGVCTFQAPFVVTGNGYFASWVGLAVIVKLAVPFLPFHKTLEMESARQSQVVLSKTQQADPVEITIEQQEGGQPAAPSKGESGGGGFFGGWFGGGGGAAAPPATKPAAAVPEAD